MRAPRKTFSAVEPNRTSSGGVERPRTPITIIGRSRSRAILSISTNGMPTTIMRSTLMLARVDTFNASRNSFSACCAQRVRDLFGSCPSAAATASLTKFSSIDMQQRHVAVRRGDPHGDAHGVDRQGEKSTGTSMSGAFSMTNPPYRGRG